MQLSLPQPYSTLLQRVHLKGWVTPLCFLGIVLLAYGLWLPRLGLFGNDWAYLWYFHRLGPVGPGEFAAIDRPLSGWFYAASTFLLGESILSYHLFLLLLRWLSVVLLWWVLRLVWPERSREAVLAAALCAVYPGFLQSPIAVEFILHFAILDLLLLSMGASLLAVGQPARRSWGWVVLVVVGAAGVFSLEYFIGLEVLRPVFLWIVTRRRGLRGRAQWKAIAAVWWPVLAVLAVFIFWRVFVFAFPTYQPVLLNELAAHPLGGLRQLAVRVINGLWIGLPRAWQQVFSPLPNFTLPTLALVLVSFGLLSLFFYRLEQQKNPVEKKPGSDHWGEIALALGLLAMVAGGAPFWVTGIPITLEFPWDRPLLALMPGASLALAGLLVMLISNRYRALLAAALISLAIGMHNQNAQVYLQEWQKLQTFTWQLSWRVPALQPGSLLLFDVIPLNRYSDNDLTAVLNWTYDPENHSRQIAYKFFDLTLRLGSAENGLPALQPGLPVEHNQRGTFFKTTTSQTLALSFNPPECLKVLSPADASRADLPEHLKQVLPLTNRDQVIPQVVSPARPPAALGPEPVHDWCYYFEKADLAVQAGDWQAAAQLGNQSLGNGMKPNSPDELLPFIEGYARAGEWTRATELSRSLLPASTLKPRVCELWKRLSGVEGGQSGAAQILSETGCP